MNQMIDLCGTPIQLDQIKDFRLVKRECLYYPAYQETESQVASIFARFGAEKKKKFTFTQMVPFGILLSDKEKPCTGSYEIKSFGEAITFNLLDGVKRYRGESKERLKDAALTIKLLATPKCIGLFLLLVLIFCVMVYLTGFGTKP